MNFSFCLPFQSLHGLERSLSVEQQKSRPALLSPAPLSKTLARLQKIKDSANTAKSAPTTPDTENTSAKIPKFPKFPSRQSNLSKSMDFEGPEVNNSLSLERNWLSNEGLTTSGSGGLPTPMEPMSPAIKKIMPNHGLILR